MVTTKFAGTVLGSSVAAIITGLTIFVGIVITSGTEVTEAIATYGTVDGTLVYEITTMLGCPGIVTIL
jgi:hypothetical protein